MIELDQVKARAAPVGLGPVSLRFQAGISALVGTKSDGVSLLLDVIAARAKAKAGRVQVLGGAPDAPSVRRAVGYVPLDAVLPDALRVSEALDLARTIRGEEETGDADARGRLSVLGIESLATRRLGTLDVREVRAVALAEALTSKAVRVVLIEEPFATVDARALGALPALLKQRAKEGACIVIGTASTRDARDLTDQRFAFDRGILLAEPHVRATEAELHVVARDPRALAGALAKESAIAEIVASDQRVIVRGTDTLAMAHAVARAVLASGVELDSLRLEPLSPLLHEK